MIIFDILIWIAEIFIFLYVFADLVCSVRNNKYQKIWNKEKAQRLRIDPGITRAELCEQYVMFCKRNDCKVDY
jgi:hypothetical protein